MAQCAACQMQPGLCVCSDLAPMIHTPDCICEACIDAAMGAALLGVEACIDAAMGEALLGVGGVMPGEAQLEKKKCECGSETIGGQYHSHYCPKFEGDKNG